MFGLGKLKAEKNSRKQASRKAQKLTFQLHWDRRYKLLAGFVLATVMAVTLMPQEQFLPIEKIRIIGQFEELDTKSIENQLRPHLGKGFFSIDIDTLQALILNQPWVRSVSIHRVWPNELAVRITEKKALARWDEHHLLSMAGKVFLASADDFSHLPLIHGYEGQSVEVMQRYAQTKQRLAERGITVQEYREDSKGALTLILDSDLKISLGSEELERKLAQLLTVYDTQIRNRGEVIRHIDFRYSNGFAVAWKPEYLNQRGELPPRGDKNV